MGRYTAQINQKRLHSSMRTFSVKKMCASRTFCRWLVLWSGQGFRVSWPNPPKEIPKWPKLVPKKNLLCAPLKNVESACVSQSKVLSSSIYDGRGGRFLIWLNVPFRIDFKNSPKKRKSESLGKMSLAGKKNVGCMKFHSSSFKTKQKNYKKICF
jgi:hypothetical protein